MGMVPIPICTLTSLINVMKSMPQKTLKRPELLALQLVLWYT